MAATKSHNGLNRGVTDPANYGEAAPTEEIRRDIDRTRGEMDRTIDELSERLRPRNLFDDLVDSVRCSILGPSTTSTGQQRMMSDQVREATSRAGRTFIEAVRENPVPAALMGAGLAWLLFEDKAERTYRRYRIESNARGYTGNRYTDPGTHSGSYVDARTGRPYDESYGAGYADMNYDGEPDVCPPGMMDRAASAASSVRGAASSTAGAVGGAASSVTHALGSAAHTIGDVAGKMVEGAKSLASTTAHVASTTGRGVRTAGHSVGEFGRTAGSSVREAGSSVREYGSSAAGSVRCATRSAASSVADFGHTAAEQARIYSRKAGEGASYGYAVSRERFNDALDEKPMAVGIAALAAGVLAGFAMPSTRMEDETLGRRSDRLKEEARRRAEEALSQGKEVASHLADTAMGEAEGAGLVPGSVGEKVARIAKDAFSAATESAKREGLDAATLAGKAKQVGQAVAAKGKEEIKQAVPETLSGKAGETSSDACAIGASASLGAADLGSRDFGGASDFGAGLTAGGLSDGMSAGEEDAEVKHDIAEGMSASSKSKTSTEKLGGTGDACSC